MPEEVRFLTLTELCFKLRISDDCARGLLAEKRLTGMRLRNGEWRIVDPGQRFERYIQEMDEHLVHVPLLSSQEVATILGKHPVYVRALVKQKKLIPATQEGKRRLNRFTVAEVRRFLISRQKIKHHQGCCVKIELLIQWAKQFLEQPNAESVPATVDEIDQMVTQILKLREPDRSRSLQALFLKLDKTDQIVRSSLPLAKIQKNP